MQHFLDVSAAGFGGLLFVLSWLLDSVAAFRWLLFVSRHGCLSQLLDSVAAFRLLGPLLVLWVVFQTFIGVTNKHHVQGYGKQKDHQNAMFHAWVKWATESKATDPYSPFVSCTRAVRSKEDFLRLKFPRIGLLNLKAKVYVDDSWDALLMLQRSLSSTDNFWSESAYSSINQVWVTMAPKKRTSCTIFRQDYFDVCFQLSNMIFIWRWINQVFRNVERLRFSFRPLFPVQAAKAIADHYFKNIDVATSKKQLVEQLGSEIHSSFTEVDVIDRTAPIDIAVEQTRQTLFPEVQKFLRLTDCQRQQYQSLLQRCHRWKRKF